MTSVRSIFALAALLSMAAMPFSGPARADLLFLST